MRVAIPDDWDGERWLCARVQWPDSREYRAILVGFLSYLMRGRYWDERTGSIQDAQAVGWEIFNRNVPLVPCTSLPGPVLSPTDGIGNGASITILEDDDMGQVVTEVKWVGGKLRIYYGHCCYDELDIASGVISQGESDQLGDDPLNPTNDPNFVYSACGKAKAIVDIVYQIVETAWNEIDTLPEYWKIIPHIEQTVGYDLDNKYLIALMGVMVTAQGLGFDLADFTDASDRQRVLSQLVTLFEDTPAGIPDNEAYEAVKAIFYSETFSWVESSQDIFNLALNALGRVDMDTVAKLGAANTDADCGDPGEWITVPVVHDWVHHYDFRVGLHGFTDVQNMWVIGLGLINTDVDWAERLGDVHKDPVATGGNMVFMALKVNVWPTNPGNGGVAPRWLWVDADSFYDAAFIGSAGWISWTPSTPPLIDGEIGAGAYQFDQTVPGDPSGVSQWYQFVIAGTGTDPFPGDP